MKLREEGFTSLGSAARSQIKAQTPPKGYLWLCEVILLRPQYPTSVYWHSIGPMETWPPWLWGTLGLTPKQGGGVPNAGNRKSKHLHKATGKNVLNSTVTTELMEHGNPIRGDPVMESLLELAKPAWFVETEGGLALGAHTWAGSHTQGSLSGRRGMKDLPPGSSRERQESMGVPLCWLLWRKPQGIKNLWEQQGASGQCLVWSEQHQVLLWCPG